MEKFFYESYQSLGYDSRYNYIYSVKKRMALGTPEGLGTICKFSVEQLTLENQSFSEISYDFVNNTYNYRVSKQVLTILMHNLDLASDRNVSESFIEEFYEVLRTKLIKELLQKHNSILY